MGCKLSRETGSSLKASSRKSSKAAGIAGGLAIAALHACGGWALVAAPFPVSAQDRIERVQTPIRVQLDAMSTGALVTFLMRDIMRVPYVIAPDVLQDRRPMSINLVMPPNEVPTRVVAFLRDVGFSVELRGGTVFVARRAGPAGFSGNGPAASGGLLPGQVPPAGEGSSYGTGPVYGSVEGDGYGATLPRPRIPGQAPSLPEAVIGAPADSPTGFTSITEGDFNVLVVRLAHRRHDEIGQVLRDILPDISVSESVGVEAQGDVIQSPSTADYLAISGSQKRLELAAQLVRALDKPRPNVEIRAVIMEVAERSERGSTLSILGSLFGGRVTGSSFDGVAANPQSFGLNVGGLSAVLSVIKDDGRFAIVAEPRIVMRDGANATLVSGADVPTLGAITVTPEGQVVRSVIYRQSGLTVNVGARVQGDGVDLTVRQERSSFGRTTTGVDDSPTLNTSSISTEAFLEGGEVLVLAGIEQTQTDSTSSGILPGILGSRRKSESRSQLVVMLEAVRVDPRASERETDASFIDLPVSLPSDDDEKATPSPAPHGSEPAARTGLSPVGA